MCPSGLRIKDIATLSSGSSPRQKRRVEAPEPPSTSKGCASRRSRPLAIEVSQQLRPSVAFLGGTTLLEENDEIEIAIRDRKTLGTELLGGSPQVFAVRVGSFFLSVMEICFTSL